jgi:acyl carrier protein
MEEPTFDQFAEFIREWAQVSRKKEITKETLFERDLGITGDDGIDLLTATEERFGVDFDPEPDGFRKAFNLGPNEYLFHAEGFGLTVFEFTSIFGSATPTVKAFTVGELYEAVRKAVIEKRPH